MKDAFNGLVFLATVSALTIPFAVWKWIELIIGFVKWFSTHWN